MNSTKQTRRANNFARADLHIGLSSLFADQYSFIGRRKKGISKLTSDLEPFADFIRSCAFIHDDSHNFSNGVGCDWDHHGTRPFLIGATTCVSNGLECFGSPYLDYLDRLGALPKTLIVPKELDKPVLISLMNDNEAISQLKTVVQQNRLDLSTYYSAGAVYSDLLALMTTKEHQPKIHPHQNAFSLANDKIKVRRLLAANHLPVPYGAVCESPDDVRRFYDEVSSRYREILIKRDHWDTVRVKSPGDINETAFSFRYPVVAEVCYPVQASPVSHNLAWRGKISHLFTVMQVIHEYHHEGNSIPVQLPKYTLERIKEYSGMIIDQIPEYSGVIGIDFIVTTEGDLFAVDVNPRFNSSTYPFYFLQRFDTNLISFAHYGFAGCRAENLSSIFTHKDFQTFSAQNLEGILLFSPVLDHTRNLISTLSYLCVSRSRERLATMERQFQQILKGDFAPR